MPFSLADFQYWPLLTRLGEMQLLVPAACVAIWRMHREADARPLAAWWLLALAVATLITTASKVAFIGWGVGSASLNFTGISGHAMFAGAIFPVLMGAFASHAKPWWFGQPVPHPAAPSAPCRGGATPGLVHRRQTGAIHPRRLVEEVLTFLGIDKCTGELAVRGHVVRVSQ